MPTTGVPAGQRAPPGHGRRAWLASEPVADVRIRLAEVADAEAIRTIYNLEVTTRRSRSTSCPAPSTTSAAGWRPARAPPAVVAVDGDDAWSASRRCRRTRSGPPTATTVEDSVYVAPDRQGQGVGRLLLAELVTLATATASTP